MKSIYLVRHGRTLFNHLNKVQGCSDSPLTETGERKADELGARFKSHGIPFDIAYTSDMGRARQTAKRLIAHSASPHVSLIETTDLREVSFGMFEGGPNDLMWREAAREVGIPELQADAPDELKIKALGAIKRLDTIHIAEDYEDVRKRIYRALDLFATSDASSLLAVSHGLYIDCLIYALSHETRHVTFIPNTSVTKLVYQNNRFDIEYIGQEDNL
ncbi:histidine phosphatase family protein [Sporolactobacillus sp. THM7-7]|nr:histidine phosphatase family protein [Sporolactobacillus sp. THM7-7]